MITHMPISTTLRVRAFCSTKLFFGARAICDAQRKERHAIVFHSPSGAVGLAGFSRAAATRLVPPDPMSRTRSLSRATNCALSSRAARQSRSDVSVRSVDRPGRRRRRGVQPVPHVRRRAPPREPRKNWIAALDRLAALLSAIVVAGHRYSGAASTYRRRSRTPSAICWTLTGCRKNRDVRPGAVRSDDGAISALGSQISHG